MSSHDTREESSTDPTNPYAPDNLGHIDVVAGDCRTGDYHRMPLTTAVLDALDAADAERLTADRDGKDVILRTGSGGELGDWAAIRQTKLGPSVVEALGVAPGDQVVAHDEGDRVRLEAEVEIVTEGAFVACDSTNSGAHKKLHTDRDCLGLTSAVRIREATQGEIDSREWCDYCTGEFEQPEPDWGAYEAAMEAGSDGGEGE